MRESNAVSLQHVSHSHTSDCTIFGEAQLPCASLQVSLEYFTVKCKNSTICITNDLNLVKIKYLEKGYKSQHKYYLFGFFSFYFFFFFMMTDEAWPHGTSLA